MKMSATRGLLPAFLISTFCFAFAVGEPYLLLDGTVSLVKGATGNFSAVLYEKYPDKLAPEADYIFHWSDSSNPTHKWQDRTQHPYSNWVLKFPNTTAPGRNRISCRVERNYIFWFNVAQRDFGFTITDNVLGNIEIYQNKEKRKDNWVSTGTSVNHSIILHEEDLDYLQATATDISIYWFQNCSYIGMSHSLSYEALYADEYEEVNIEALLVASFDQIPEPTTSTTTTTTTPAPTTSTTTTTTTSTTTTTTPKTTSTTTTTTTANTTAEMATSTTIKPNRSKRDVEDSIADAINRTMHKNAEIMGVNMTLQHKRVLQEALERTPPPYNCTTKEFYQRDPHKLYGYFTKRFVSINPINNFTSVGKNWLQHGELVDLDIKCKGTVPMERCILVFKAPYNATGKEVCQNYYKEDECHIRFRRYFSESKTVLFFIRNPVSSTVNQVTVNIYEAKKASQLSVVVVPVSFTLIAVILVVFGVAYYVQSRNRFTVEVADFNFGETQSTDMEYKTFSQRLFDSICEIIPRRRRFSQTSSDNGAEPDSPIGVSHSAAVNSNLPYDSMT